MNRECVLSWMSVCLLSSYMLILLFKILSHLLYIAPLYDVFNFEGPCLVPSMGAVLRCGAIFVEIAFLFCGIAVLHERVL